MKKEPVVAGDLCLVKGIKGKLSVMNGRFVTAVRAVQPLEVVPEIGATLRSSQRGWVVQGHGLYVHRIAPVIELQGPTNYSVLAESVMYPLRDPGADAVDEVLRPLPKEASKTLTETQRVYQQRIQEK